MPFIGKQPEVGAYQLIDSITTSATATYALTVDGSAYFPASARNLIVSLNGVTQAPESAYTVSGSNIVFDSALTASDVIDYILVIGDAVDIGTPSDGTVGTDQLASTIDLSGKTLTFANDQISGDVISGGTATLDGLTVDTNTLYVDSTNNRVGIGDTAPDVKLKIKGGTGTIEPQFTIESTAFNAGQGTALNFSRAGFDQPIQARISAVDNGAAGSNFIFSTKVDGTAGALTERMRLDSSGKVLINETTFNSGYSSFANMQISHSTAPGLIINTDTAGASNYGRLAFTIGNSTGNEGLIRYNSNDYHMSFWTNAGERMRIDSSGNLLVGVTGKLNGNTSYSFQNNATTDNSMWIHNDNASDGTAKLVLTSRRTATSAFNFIDCGANYPTSFTRQFLVRGDGVVYAQNTSIQSLSDERTKENIRDSEDGLDVVNALRPVRFDFKEGFGNNRTNQLGFIAQEVEPVFADAVSEATETDERGVPYKSLGPSSLIPVLVKAIQEQQAMIETLQAQVAELQGAN